MSVATDILLEQMIRIRKLANAESTPTLRKELMDAINTSKTLNGSAASIIKEAAVALAMEQYANKATIQSNELIEKMGIGYVEK